MSDFNDRPFSIGSLVGVRAFSVDKYGRLICPSHGGVFKPGENVGECVGGPQSFKLPANVSCSAERGGYGHSFVYTVTMPDGGLQAYTSTRELARSFPNEEHEVGSAGCSCGFYAYFDGTNTYAKPNRVTALIEGYGVYTAGDRGFRSSKARLLALVQPGVEQEPAVAEAPEPKLSLWKRVTGSRWLVPVLLTLAVLVFGANVLAHQWVNAGTLAFWIVAITAGQVINRRSSKAHERAMSELKSLGVAMPEEAGKDVDWELIRRNYGDVPVYPTLEAAIAAHPLTVPPAPTPEDDDFWTRSAS